MSISKGQHSNRNSTDYGTVKCSQRKWWLNGNQQTKLAQSI